MYFETQGAILAMFLYTKAHIVALTSSAMYTFYSHYLVMTVAGYQSLSVAFHQD